MRASAHKSGLAEPDSSSPPRDKESFQVIVEWHRREIMLHCYRMVGSLHDAEDLTQETFLRAWQSIDRFEARASLKNWLYRIATNVCLTAISKSSKARRVLPEEINAPATKMPSGSATDEVPWVEPYPDSALENLADTSPGPAVRYEMREAVRLAFVVATQRLPARQRAVLLLRDVLGWSASETAQALEITLASANSALQRARLTLGKNLSNEEIADQSTGDPCRQAIAERYAAAWENADLDGLTGLLAKDAKLNMPPRIEWYLGRARIRAFLAYAFDRVWSSHRQGSFRMVPTFANGQIAFGTYVRNLGEPKYHAHALQVLTFKEERISRLNLFVGAKFFPKFGLPIELQSKGRSKGSSLSV
jgi:RNA polymerase sigma-70 factor (ECF subfamily)